MKCYGVTRSSVSYDVQPIVESDDDNYVCTACHVAKPAKDFGRSKDGSRYGHCLECRIKDREKSAIKRERARCAR